MVVAAVACGKKGPPLPPLVKIPTPPADFTAARRGSSVDLRFTVPSANTDGTRPANVERVDVYAFTGPASLSDDRLLKLATKVGSVPVKAPRDPDQTIEPDEPADDMEPPEGRGLDQGAPAHVEEVLTPASLMPIQIATAKTKTTPREDDDRPQPLLGAPQMPLVRNYVSVPVGKRGRKGPLSKRVGVPLVDPPPPPSAPKIEYSEHEITVSWTPPATALRAEPSGEVPPLPSRPIGPGSPEIAYHVYQVAPDGETRLTKSPIPESTYTDKRMAWGTERCYIVRTVETLGGVSVESDAPPPSCTKLVDTFPPAAPKELHGVAGEGSINLIWEPNNETDLAGYLVLRGAAPGDTLEPITPKPIPDARFTDDVKPGVRYVYAVRAVDKAGNVSPMSNRVEETAR